MAEQRVQRRLAAILAADVVGYSRLTERDESGTVARLRLLRTELLNPVTKKYGGRIFKNTGDGALVEFGSAVDAVQCAVEIQRTLAQRNGDMPEDEWIVLRIGISLGDVIVEGDDLYGNAVNVAARMEGLSEPGQICISGNVHEHVGNALDVTFEDLGDQTIKNIKRPVRSYRMRPEVGGVAKANVDRPDASPSLPDKPSIAVLPFDNMSGDPDQEYFSDGITEDIITALSHIRQFRVVSRNSSFSFKGQSPDVRRVAQVLDARYIVEGSLRRAGTRIRLTAQLIEGATGKHLWAERYDRDVSDIFDLQDELTQTLVGAIEPELSKAEQAIASVKSPEHLSAWEAYQRGMWHLHKMKADDFASAKSYLEQAIALDSGFASAYSGLALVLFYDAFFGAANSRKETGNKALAIAKKALELDNEDANAHSALAHVHRIRGELELVIIEAKEAIRLNPSLAEAYHDLGRAHVHNGDAEEGLIHLNEAIRLSPNDPGAAHFCGGRALAHLYLRQHEDAVEWASKSIRYPNPFWVVRAVLASALAHLDRTAEAKQAVEDLLQYRPGINLEFVRETLPTGDQDYLGHLLNGLRKAGLPE